MLTEAQCGMNCPAHSWEEKRRERSPGLLGLEQKLRVCVWSGGGICPFCDVGGPWWSVSHYRRECGRDRRDRTWRWTGSRGVHRLQIPAVTKRKGSWEACGPPGIQAWTWLSFTDVNWGPACSRLPGGVAGALLSWWLSLGTLVSGAVPSQVHCSGLSPKSGKDRGHREAGSCHSEGRGAGPARAHTHCANPKRLWSWVWRPPALDLSFSLSQMQRGEPGILRSWRLGPPSSDAAACGSPALRGDVGTWGHGAPACTCFPASPPQAVLFKVTVVWLARFLKNHSHTGAEFHKASCHH